MVTFSTIKEGPSFIYRSPGTRFDHRYSAIRSRNGRVPCRVRGGFLVIEWAQSITFVGNSISRNLNDCWNDIWFFMLGYYILIESFSFSRINHPTLTYKLIGDWFVSRQDIELIDWPHCSLDLNPIGNMWAQIKRHTCKIGPIRLQDGFVEARPGCLGCRGWEETFFEKTSRAHAHSTAKSVRVGRKMD